MKMDSRGIGLRLYVTIRLQVWNGDVSILAHKLDIAHGNVRQGLLFWNGGGDKLYPDRVLALMSRYQVPTNHDAVQDAAAASN